MRSTRPVWTSACRRGLRAGLRLARGPRRRPSTGVRPVAARARGPRSGRGRGVRPMWPRGPEVTFRAP